MKTEISQLIQLFGFAGVIGGFITMFITFAVAFADPAKAVTVQINHYNEAWPEALFLLGAIILLPHTIKTYINGLAAKY